MTDDLFSAGFAWATEEVSQTVATPVATPPSASLTRGDDPAAGRFGDGVATVASVANHDADHASVDHAHPVSQTAATLSATAKSEDLGRFEAAPPPAVATVASVADWRQGIAMLDPGKVPVGADAYAWRRLVWDARQLMSLWGDDLKALGWTVLDVFGVEPNPAHRRFDRLGLVNFIDGGTVEAVDASSAWTMHGKDRLTFRLRPRLPGAIPIWGLASPGAPGERADALPPSPAPRQARRMEESLMGGVG